MNNFLKKTENLINNEMDKLENRLFLFKFFRFLFTTEKGVWLARIIAFVIQTTVMTIAFRYIIEH